MPASIPRSAAWHELWPEATCVCDAHTGPCLLMSQWYPSHKLIQWRPALLLEQKRLLIVCMATNPISAQKQHYCTWCSGRDSQMMLPLTQTTCACPAPPLTTHSSFKHMFPPAMRSLSMPCYLWCTRLTWVCRGQGHCKCASSIHPAMWLCMVPRTAHREACGNQELECSKNEHQHRQLDTSIGHCLLRTCCDLLWAAKLPHHPCWGSDVHPS